MTYTSPSVAECRLVQWKPYIRAPSTATIRSAGSNHGSAIRSASSSASMPPCSGWWAKAAAFTRSSSASSAGRKLRTSRLGAVKPRLPAGPRTRPAADASPTAPARGRTRTRPPGGPRRDGRRATRPATRGQPTREHARASARRRRCGDGPGATTRCRSSPSSTVIPMPGSTWMLELVRVVAQPSPGALVEGLRAVGRRRRVGDRAQRRKGGVVHGPTLRAAPPAGAPQASWESRARSALAVFSTAGITKR